MDSRLLHRAGHVDHEKYAGCRNSRSQTQPAIDRGRAHWRTALDRARAGCEFRSIGRKKRPVRRATPRGGKSWKRPLDRRRRTRRPPRQYRNERGHERYRDRKGQRHRNAVLCLPSAKTLPYQFDETTNASDRRRARPGGIGGDGRQGQPLPAWRVELLTQQTATYAGGSALLP